MRRYLVPFRGLETIFAVRFSAASITNVSGIHDGYNYSTPERA
jgi:hypothetical protein